MSAAEIEGCKSPDCHDTMKGLISKKMSKIVFYPVVIALAGSVLGLAGWAYSGHESRIRSNEKKVALAEQAQEGLAETIIEKLAEILDRLPKGGGDG